MHRTLVLCYGAAGIITKHTFKCKTCVWALWWISFPSMCFFNTPNQLPNHTIHRDIKTWICYACILCAPKKLPGHFPYCVFIATWITYNIYHGINSMDMLNPALIQKFNLLFRFALVLVVFLIFLVFQAMFPFYWMFQYWLFMNSLYVSVQWFSIMKYFCTNFAFIMLLRYVVFKVTFFYTSKVTIITIICTLWSWFCMESLIMHFKVMFS